MPITPKGAEGTVQFGLSNVYIASVTETRDPITGAITTAYGTPKAWPGAVKMTLNSKATLTDTYADNGIYFTVESNPGYDGTFESMKVPEWAAAELLGRTVDDNGMLIETSEDRGNYFALLFEVDGDTFPTRFVYYKCKLSQPSGDWETTNESGATPKTASATLKILPRGDIDVIDGINRHAIAGTCSPTADATAYDGFFSAVLEPAV